MIRPATEEDAHFLAPRLRKEDVAEIKAASNREPLDAILDGIRLGPSLVLVGGNGPYCIGGMAQIPHNLPIAVVWMLATPEVVKHPVELMRYSKIEIRRLLKYFHAITNVVDARNTVHIAWLKRLGFQFVKLHHTYGAACSPFYEFVRYQRCAPRF